MSDTSTSRLHLLGPLGSIFRSALLAVGSPSRVQRSTNDVIAHSRKVSNPAASDKNNRVLLQIVADAGDIRRHFHAVGKPDPGHFTQR